MEDHGRNHLVTLLVCSDCGNLMNMKYGEPKKAGCPDDGITGASKLENRIQVHPCETCVGRARRPLELMRQAMQSLERPTGDTNTKG